MRKVAVANYCEVRGCGQRQEACRRQYKTRKGPLETSKRFSNVLPSPLVGEDRRCPREVSCKPSAHFYTRVHQAQRRVGKRLRLLVVSSPGPGLLPGRRGQGGTNTNNEQPRRDAIASPRTARGAEGPRTAPSAKTVHPHRSGLRAAASAPLVVERRGRRRRVRFPLVCATPTTWPGPVKLRKRAAIRVPSVSSAPCP